MEIHTSASSRELNRTTCCPMDMLLESTMPLPRDRKWVQDHFVTRIDTTLHPMALGFYSWRNKCRVAVRRAQRVEDGVNQQQVSLMVF